MNMGLPITITDCIDKKEFMSLPSYEARTLVIQKKSPLSGIFMADGNRRLVMTLTGLTPNSNGFYPAYLDIVTSLFMNNLDVFFDHGLTNLFFPIFGASLLDRDDAYKQSVIPGLTNRLFQDEQWLRFYKLYDIRVKPYGFPEKLDEVFPVLNLSQKIYNMAALTASHKSHTLYFGFFSEPCPDAGLAKMALRFFESHNREPNRRDWIELFYGEYAPPADFFINSTRIAGLGALPPFIADKHTKIYTTVAPGVFALDQATFRGILYDLLFSGPPTVDSFPADIKSLKKFYSLHKNTVIGVGNYIGGFKTLRTEFK